MTADPTPDSAVIERELAVEQAHIDAVYARLEEATRSAEQVATEGRSLFQTDRSSFVREEDGTGLFERDVFAFQAAKRLAVLDAEHEGLVFGRLDRTDGEIRYIGRIGVRDEDYEPLVIDWRARAAEPFYRATPTEPMEVVRRRVLRCRGDKVIGIEDDLLDSTSTDTDLVIVGEGALMAALSRARGPQMRDIVATIQSEQDEAIRAPYQGFTIISGGPGTGKTVVALHRAAYLLYSHRRRFENGGVLVVGPSRVFMNYIERVLPSLGEDSVTLRAIGSVASDVLGFRAERVDSAALHVIKGSTRMLPLLRRLVNEPLVAQSADQARLRVVIKGEVLTLSADRLASIRENVLRHHKLNQGRGAAEQGALAALWELKPDEIEIERDEFDDLVTDQAAYRMFMQSWWPSLSPVQVLVRLGDARLTARLAHDILSREEAERLAASYVEAADWSVADVALLDELGAILGPVVEEAEADPLLFLADGADVAEVVTTADRAAQRREVDPFADAHETFAHVLVDEAQDITPMQWRMLRRRGAQASWTIVGDPAQSSWPDQEESGRVLNDLIGRAPHRNFRMSTNYRSPAEVFELAAKVVQTVAPHADLPRAVRHTDIEPRLLATTLLDQDGALVDELRVLVGQVEGTIGVIAPPSRIGHVNRVLNRSALTEHADRISVVTPLESKGLEYDAVFVLSPDEIVAESPGGVRVLYVALTRPTQRLVTLDVTSDGRAGEWRGTLD
ncbi:HelD family protein [Granulicoccus sp. GXG6511]|uniref:HelD family protein n=1 Tax=Granulicoccus sp. GXG6511 TaxID=3381351 RepID=UPI003D7C8196